MNPNYCHNAIDDYAQRWGIETLFGIFKSRGFNLEDTHLIDSERLSRLFALLTIALCWAYRTGQWLSDHKPIVIKKHGRKAKSIFRYGFDHLRSIFLNLDEFQTDFLQSLEFLSCT
ncbi:transposase [Waterburya agarophytonicola K14]|uniref:Transposase n=1 Tax=Waterburya agarophytonicola KI4 TaxID=2874699 RepID=A0A964BRI1_9CYAN|nr:transposase [Waterburya agarophytonicola KI4]